MNNHPTTEHSTEQPTANGDPSTFLLSSSSSSPQGFVLSQDPAKEQQQQQQQQQHQQQQREYYQKNLDLPPGGMAAHPYPNQASMEEEADTEQCSDPSSLGRRLRLPAYGITTSTHTNSGSGWCLADGVEEFQREQERLESLRWKEGNILLTQQLLPATTTAVGIPVVVTQPPPDPQPVISSPQHPLSTQPFSRCDTREKFWIIIIAVVLLMFVVVVVVAIAVSGDPDPSSAPTTTPTPAPTPAPKPTTTPTATPSTSTPTIPPSQTPLPELYSLTVQTAVRPFEDSRNVYMVFSRQNNRSIGETESFSFDLDHNGTAFVYEGSVDPDMWEQWNATIVSANNEPNSTKNVTVNTAVSIVIRTPGLASEIGAPNELCSKSWTFEVILGVEQFIPEVDALWCDWGTAGFWSYEMGSNVSLIIV